MRNSFIEHNKCQVLTLFSSINSKPLSVLIRFDPIRFDVSGQWSTADSSQIFNFPIEEFNYYYQSFSNSWRSFFKICQATFSCRISSNTCNTDASGRAWVCMPGLLYALLMCAQSRYTDPSSSSVCNTGTLAEVLVSIGKSRWLFIYLFFPCMFGSYIVLNGGWIALT